MLGYESTGNRIRINWKLGTNRPNTEYELTGNDTTMQFVVSNSNLFPVFSIAGYVPSTRIPFRSKTYWNIFLRYCASPPEYTPKTVSRVGSLEIAVFWKHILVDSLLTAKTKTFENDWSCDFMSIHQLMKVQDGGRSLGTMQLFKVK